MTNDEIKKFAKDCHKKHKEMWGFIIDDLLKMLNNNNYKEFDINATKRKFFKDEFDMCSPCYGCYFVEKTKPPYKYRLTCKPCLFKMEDDEGLCLDGLWDKINMRHYVHSRGLAVTLKPFTKSCIKRKVLIARKIRNFKLKKEHEYEGCYDN